MRSLAGGSSRREAWTDMSADKLPETAIKPDQLKTDEESYYAEGEEEEYYDEEDEAEQIEKKEEDVKKKVTEVVKE